MTNLDSMILKIIKELDKLTKKVVDKFDILEEIFYFKEELAITDSVSAVTEYVPQTTLETMTIRDAKVYE